MIGKNSIHQSIFMDESKNVSVCIDTKFHKTEVFVAKLGNTPEEDGDWELVETFPHGIITESELKSRHDRIVKNWDNQSE